MKLNKKQIEFLDNACLSKFGINFDTMYKSVEANQELKEKAKLEAKRLKDEAKRLRQLQKEAQKHK